MSTGSRTHNQKESIWHSPVEPNNRCQPAKNLSWTRFLKERCTAHKNKFNTCIYSNCIQKGETVNKHLISFAFSYFLVTKCLTTVTFPFSAASDSQLAQYIQGLFAYLLNKLEAWVEVRIYAAQCTYVFIWRYIFNAKCIEFSKHFLKRYLPARI